MGNTCRELHSPVLILSTLNALPLPVCSVTLCDQSHFHHFMAAEARRGGLACPSSHRYWVIEPSFKPGHRALSLNARWRGCIPPRPYLLCQPPTPLHFSQSNKLFPREPDFVGQIPNKVWLRVVPQPWGFCISLRTARALTTLVI